MTTLVISGHGLSWWKEQWPFVHHQAAAENQIPEAQHVQAPQGNRNILTRLGFTSRTQVAGWMATQDR